MKNTCLHLVTVLAVAVLLAACSDSDSQLNSKVDMEKQSDGLDTWGRPGFQPGGGDPFLFYVIFGEIDTSAPLLRSVFRSDGIPDGLTVMSYGPETRPEIVGSFRKGYLWDQFQEKQPEVAKLAERQQSCLVLKGEIDDPEDLKYFRDTIGLIAHFLKHGGVAIYDPLMFEWWTPEEWNERFFAPDNPVPLRHTVILVSKESDGRHWFHTRGLRKFGRPDISMRRVPARLTNVVAELFNRFIDLQAAGGVIEQNQKITMAGFPSGAVCRNAGERDDPEVNNVHVEIIHDFKDEQID